MAPFSGQNARLIPKNVIENITLKKILLLYPEAITYKSLIRFKHEKGKATLNLDLLPRELAAKICKLFYSPDYNSF